MKSDTPRTDKVTNKQYETIQRKLDALENHARQLERELNEAKAKITELEKACHSKWMEGFDDGFKDGRLRERREWTSTT